MRKKSSFLVDKFDNDMYTIHFIVQRTDEISRRQKFKHIKRTVGSNRSIYLCKECDSYLSSERELPVNKSAKNYGLHSYTLPLSIKELQMYIKTNAGSSCLIYEDTGGSIHYLFSMKIRIL